MLWQSPLVCGLSDRRTKKQVPELAMAGILELSADALGARHGATTPPPNAGLVLNASRTSAERAAVSFGAQPTAANTIFLKEAGHSAFSSY